jgi:dTDP-4-dehydrorhamnose 3,5-epimerase
MFGQELAAHTTNIPGLVWYDLPVHGDARGWFKENWQKEKMTAIGLPDFSPVQNNISFNAERGVTRGIHAEPWDKYVSVGSGKIFGAWVDLREGETFGEKFTLEIDPSKAIFIPRGVGNAFQALEANTVYTYLVNDHWSADTSNYAFVNLGCSKVGIDWPIPLDQAELSDKDKNHPHISEVTPITPRKILVTGANGQLGKALQIAFPDAEFVDRTTFDIADPTTWGDRNWRQYDTIINAAAYTKVDEAETSEGRVAAWEANAQGATHLVRLANENNLTLVHISSDYVFDGTNKIHTEDEPFSPINTYGQSKAAADNVIATAKKHYIVRTSWVIGEGNNFVRTMQSLAERGIKPTVVDDQIGRLTFTEDIVAGIKHLLATKQAFGTYNLTNDGETTSWADVAKKVYEFSGKNPDDVTGVSTAAYFIDKPQSAPRPLQSTLDISKIQNAGFSPRRWDEVLREYLEQPKV